MKISATVSHQFVTDPERLINNLSFSHIKEIMVIDDAFERFFYETECIRCNWSVRELRRQIKTNLYFRTGISKKPELLLQKSADHSSNTTLTRYYFIDMIFYNRILHCNVIIELKNDEFKHEDLGQLNAYVGYYKKNEMSEGDNPPVGILLCTAISGNIRKRKTKMSFITPSVPFAERRIINMKELDALC